MKWRFLLPLTYLALSPLLLIVFGGCGGGWGIGAFYYLSLPIAYLVPDSKYCALWSLVLGVIQYHFIGALIDHIRKKRGHHPGGYPGDP